MCGYKLISTLMCAAFCFITLSFNTQARDVIYTLDAAEILYFYDGDTLFIKCPGNGFVCDKKLGIRVKGVDTPELGKAQCDYEKALAQKAKQFSVAAVRGANEIQLVVNTREVYDRYKRLLAYVVLDGNDLGNSLISNGLGRQYGGGKRAGWCD
jgi:micrococcal nuclease